MILLNKNSNQLKANYKKYNREEMISLTAKELSNEKTVGWFQGRMEFGPRVFLNYIS